MKNTEMKPNRFLRLYAARKRFAEITAHLSAGGSVMLVTHTKATVFGPKHISYFKVAGSSVYVRRGKSWDCIDYTPVRFSRAA